MGSPVAALSAAAAILSDSSYALIIGELLAAWWLSATARAAAVHFPNLRRLAATCLAVLIVCHLLRPWLVASNMSGSTRFQETLALVPTILSSTRQGGLWYANSIALAVMLGVRFLGGRSFSIGMEIAGLCVLAATKAASSHASEEGDLTLAEISQLVHILATSVWAGSVVISGFFIVPRLAALDAVAALWSYGSRLSKTVTWALAMLLLSGFYTAWHDIHGNISALWTGAWGRTLLAKIAFVGFAMSLGSLTRFRCLRRPASPDRASAMTRLLRFEAIVMMAILCISGLLANTNPAG